MNTLRTITFDAAEWQVVPKNRTEDMREAAPRLPGSDWARLLLVAPEPPAQQINQCDGCRRGLPVNDHGIHRAAGYDFIACTAHLYQPPAQKPKHTPGPWERIHETIYALTHAGWRKGVEQFKNRMTVQVSFDKDVDEAEAEATLALIQAAPDLLEALKYARRFLRAEDHDVAFVDAAIAKVGGEQ